MWAEARAAAEKVEQDDNEMEEKREKEVSMERSVYRGRKCDVSERWRVYSLILVKLVTALYHFVPLV